MYNCNECDVVYFDFSKALILCHMKDIRKEEAHGIGGGVLSWTRAWLFQRKQRVSSVETNKGNNCG